MLIKHALSIVTLTVFFVSIIYWIDSEFRYDQFLKMAMMRKKSIDEMIDIGMINKGMIIFIRKFKIFLDKNIGRFF